MYLPQLPDLLTLKGNAGTHGKVCICHIFPIRGPAEGAPFLPHLAGNVWQSVIVAICELTKLLCMSIAGQCTAVLFQQRSSHQGERERSPAVYMDRGMLDHLIC